MDPTDLLELQVPSLDSLPHHVEENDRVLAILKAEEEEEQRNLRSGAGAVVSKVDGSNSSSNSNRIPRYTRMNDIKSFEDIRLAHIRDRSKEAFKRFQKSRLTVSESFVSSFSEGETLIETATEEQSESVGGEG